MKTNKTRPTVINYPMEIRSLVAEKKRAKKKMAAVQDTWKEKIEK